MPKQRYYGKILEQIELPSKEEQEKNIPIIISEDDIPSLTDIINFLNHKDKDILFLSFISGKTQTDIVRILNRSQPSLSYDIKRIKERIKFICFLHSKFSDFTNWVENEAYDHFCPEDVMVMTLMYFTTSFSQSAKVAKIKPTRVRYIFDKVCEKLKIIDHPIYDLFIEIRNSLNVVKRTYSRKGITF